MDKGKTHSPKENNNKRECFVSWVYYHILQEWYLFNHTFLVYFPPPKTIDSSTRDFPCYHNFAILVICSTLTSSTKKYASYGQ